MSFGSPTYNVNNGPSGIDTLTHGTTDATGGTNRTVVHNCSAANESILAHGSNATGPSVTSWALSDSNNNVCTLGTNFYKYRLLQFGLNAETYLTTADKALIGVGSNNSVAWDNYLAMPCAGSSGAGLEFRL